MHLPVPSDFEKLFLIVEGEFVEHFTTSLILAPPPLIVRYEVLLAPMIRKRHAKPDYPERGEHDGGNRDCVIH